MWTFIVIWSFRWIRYEFLKSNYLLSINIPSYKNLTLNSLLSLGILSYQILLTADPPQGKTLPYRGRQSLPAHLAISANSPPSPVRAPGSAARRGWTFFLLNTTSQTALLWNRLWFIITDGSINKPSVMWYLIKEMFNLGALRSRGLERARPRERGREELALIAKWAGRLCLPL